MKLIQIRCAALAAVETATLARICHRRVGNTGPIAAAPGATPVVGV